MLPALVTRFLETKAQSLKGRARRLVNLTPESVGLRKEDMRYAPSPAHFAAARARLAEIDKTIRLRMEQLEGAGRADDPHDAVIAMAMVEREIDRARRTFGLFFEVFGQRGTGFAPALAAYDAVALDCYRAVGANLPVWSGHKVLRPLTYLEHGYSPATMRRGVTLHRLLGESNPFPLIRIPWDRDHPWQAVFLHEVAHNLQADLGLWVENQQAVLQRFLESKKHPRAITVYGRWHKEIFADLAAVLLGGPAVAWGMAEFLAHPPSRVMTYRPGGAHPVGYLRTLILAEMLRKMGFKRDAEQLEQVWQRLYRLSRGHRLPSELLDGAVGHAKAVVDEIAFQPRRGMAEHTLADVIHFGAEDQARIRAGARMLQAGRVPDLPPRFLVSASRYAIEAGAPISALGRLLITHLANLAAQERRQSLVNRPTLIKAA